MTHREFRGPIHQLLILIYVFSFASYESYILKFKEENNATQTVC